MDNDIWGDDYKIPKKWMLGYPPKIIWTMARRIEIDKQPFLVHHQVVFKCAANSSFGIFTEDELQALYKRL